ncbi:MAG TPA: hypothetical protein VFK82_08535 [Burkholderiaceae bacterium]|nr:hypothetical protein [Burkholderiaceae bacterium]
MNRDPDFLKDGAFLADEHCTLPEGDASIADGLDAAETLAMRPAATATTAQGAVLIGFAQGGCRPMILRPGECVAEQAESVLSLDGKHLGRRLAILPFAGNDVQWLVIGVLAGQPGWPAARPESAIEVEADGRKIALLATEEISLRCGKAQLRLRADGRVEIRGETIISEAVRANRIRGGSVELN